MSMKRFLFSVAWLTAALAVSAQESKPTRISGQLEGVGDSLLYNLIDMNLDQPRSKGYYAVKDGRFDFTIDVQHPATLALMNLAVFRADDVANMKAASFTVIPGEDAVISGSLDDYRVTGSQFYEEAAQVQQELMSWFKDRTQDNREQLMKEAAAKAIDYIKAHPAQEAAMLMVQVLDYDQTVEAVKLFDPSISEGRMQYFYKPRLKMLEAQKAREAARKHIVAGQEAPDFTLPSLDGSPLSLSSLRGKYVILDFWGSWCSWCIKGLPDMKAYYQKYAGKFEILGIDCNDTEEKWRAAVEKHEIPWLHVRQSNETVKVSDEYGVSGYPTKIIIDPDGKIHKVIVGEDPEFYTYLDTLFQ